MKKYRSIEELEAEVKRLRTIIHNLSEKNGKVIEDRQKYRNFFATEFKWHIKLLGNNEHPAMVPLIEKEAKFLTTVEPFFW